MCSDPRPAAPPSLCAHDRLLQMGLWAFVQAGRSSISLSLDETEERLGSEQDVDSESEPDHDDVEMCARQLSRFALLRHLHMGAAMPQWWLVVDW